MIGLNEKLVLWEQFIDGPIQSLSIKGFTPHLYTKRLDLIKSWGSGNKYFKLKYALLDVLKKGKKIIVSKGGPYSNHLEALASACLHFDLQCVCMIRSYKEALNNPTIEYLKNNGVIIHFLPPDEYQRFENSNAQVLYPECMFIPEGGSGENGIQGAVEIYSSMREHDFTHLIIAGGTMTTVAGILSVARADLNIIIVPAWKGCTENYMMEILQRYNIQPRATWTLWPEYHFGGFAKYTVELSAYMYSFTNNTSIPLDPVYTGKMMYALNDKLNKGYFEAGDKIICIHTGGLQGIAGFNHRDPKIWGEYFKLAGNNL